MKSVLSGRVRKAGTILSIPVDLIKSNPNKIRKDFSDIDGLTDSVRKNGIIQPLCVRIEGEYFVIISGERRYRAALRLSLPFVPCIIMDASDDKSIILSLTENSFSVKPDFCEEAEMLYILNTVYGVTPDCISQLLCKSESSIASRLSFSKLSPEIKNIITENGLEDYIMSLSKLRTDDDRYKFIDFILSKQNMASERNEAVSQPVIQFNKLNNYRIFMNLIINTVDTMRNAGINAVITQKKHAGCVECVIRIPESTTSPVRKVDLSCNAV